MRSDICTRTVILTSNISNESLYFSVSTCIVRKLQNVNLRKFEFLTYFYTIIVINDISRLLFA